MFWQALGRRTSPKGAGTVIRFIWADSRELVTILDPFQSFFIQICVIWDSTPCLRPQQCELLREHIFFRGYSISSEKSYVVEAGPMSSVETKQMSPGELTGLMSSVETG